jgi:hypothetical protein
LVNRHDGLVGVVVLVCLARVVLVGGVDRPHDVFATGAFADDDENVVHLTAAVTNMGLLHKGVLLVVSLVVVVVVPATIGNKRQLCRESRSDFRYGVRHSVVITDCTRAARIAAGRPDVHSGFVGRAREVLSD